MSATEGDLTLEALQSAHDALVSLTAAVGCLATRLDIVSARLARLEGLAPPENESGNLPRVMTSSWSVPTRAES